MGEIARARIALDNNAIELRPIKPRLANGRTIRVLNGLRLGENVIAKSNLFVNCVAKRS